MPIPDPNPAGLLPPGVHDCSIDEVLERFGVFNETDRRVDLGRRLSAFHQELLEANVAVALIVDGSFVTAKAAPGDIDVALVLRSDLDLRVLVPPFQYNPRSKGYVKKKYGFDFFFCFEGQDEILEPLLTYFSQTKEGIGTKGVLRIPL